VGFRFATRRAALALGARGYVRKLPDRRVEAVFEGSEAIVEQALAFVRRGPSHARVTGVESETLPPQGFSDFEILD
jgi:acylphosphatase